MRCFLLPFTLSAALVFAFGMVGESFADPGPKARSFRTVVPIKQNVRRGMENMVSQTVTLTIPPPPIPDKAPASTSIVEDSSAEEAPANASAPESNLPPEPKPVINTEAKSAEDENPESPGGSKTPDATKTEKEKPGGPTLTQLREEAHALADKKLRYVFGADDPDSGALDCSSTIQYLLTKIGVKDVPRTSYDQYDWLKGKKLLDDVYGKSAPSKLLKKLSPGDIIFWGGTWKSGHRVSHVMLYMGYDPAEDKHYVFGARSKSSTGLTGCGVDIFELDTEKGRLVAHGKIPGLVYE